MFYALMHLIFLEQFVVINPFSCLNRLVCVSKISLFRHHGKLFDNIQLIKRNYKPYLVEMENLNSHQIPSYKSPV